jgi:glycosyltransferase involved in cell wall biosynthesis
VKRSVLAVGPISGGVGDAFTGSISSLRQRGWKVGEARPRETGSAAAAALRLAWRVRRTLFVANSVHVEFGSNDLAVFWFALIATALRRDVVLVAHDPTPFAHAPGAGLIARSGTWHLRIAYRVLSPLLDHLIVRSALHRAGAVVVFGHAEREYLQARVSRPVLYAPHGKLAEADGAPPPSACDYVLFAGFLGPSKGLDLLVRAWARVPEHPLRLQIAGGWGADQEEWIRGLRAQAAVHKSPPQWLGHIPAERDFQRLFERAAIVVLPYRRSSPASGVLIRAMTAGRCILATRVSAVVSSVEDGVSGVIVDIEDVQGLAHHLSRLSMDTAERDRLGRGAARRARAIFDWNAFAKSVETAYAAAGQTALDRRWFPRFKRRSCSGPTHWASAASTVDSKPTNR